VYFQRLKQALGRGQNIAVSDLKSRWMYSRPLQQELPGSAKHESTISVEVHGM